MATTALRGAKLPKTFNLTPQAWKITTALSRQHGLSFAETLERQIRGELVPTQATLELAETIDLPSITTVKPEKKFKNPETGEVFTVDQWCDRLNINYRQFQGRLVWAKRSGDFSKLFVVSEDPNSTTFRHTHLTFNNLTMTAGEWADRLDMSFDQFRKRYWRFEKRGEVEKAFKPTEKTPGTNFKDQLLTNPRTQQTLTAEQWAEKLGQTVKQIYFKVYQYKGTDNYYKVFEPLKRSGNTNKPLKKSKQV